MVLQEDDETKLYSDLVYDMLREGYDPFNYTEQKGKLKASLSQYTTLDTWLTKIAGAWELVSKVRAKHPYDNNICAFFYYFLGETVQKTVDKGKFLNAVDNVYAALGELRIVSSCKALNHHSSWDNFNKNKKEFEYNQDYEPKKEQLETYYKFCDEGYCEDMGTPATSSNVNIECGSSTSSKYCTKFWETYKDYCKKESTRLVCKPPPTAAPVPTIVSSIFATIGIPAIIFYLYKYTSLFSGLRNNTFMGNGRRKRRSTGRHNVDDTLTPETFSTDMSTVASTAGNSSEYSSPYTIRSGGRVNNGRPQQQQRKKQGQQKQRQQHQQRKGQSHRNIAYQRM